MNNLVLSVTWMTPGQELRASNATNNSESANNMNDSGSCARGCICYEQLKAMYNMKDSSSWAKANKCYEQLSVMDDMNDSGLWAQGFRCYE